MKLAVTIGVLALLADAPAFAEWKISSSKDRLTDKDFKVASLEAKAPDHDVKARLLVYCLKSTEPHLVMSIETTASFLPGRMGLSFRIDDRAVEDRYMPVNASGRGMSLWGDPEDLKGARRLRIRLEPYRAPNLFYEFDLAGTEKAFSMAGCAPAKPSS